MRLSITALLLAATTVPVSIPFLCEATVVCTCSYSSLFGSASWNEWISFPSSPMDRAIVAERRTEWGRGCDDGCYRSVWAWDGPSEEDGMD